MNQAAQQSANHGADGEFAPGPLFVVAMWRSGSSLIYALLNKHPQVALTFEDDLWLLRSVFHKPATYRDWAARLEFWNSALSRHGFTADDFPRGAENFPAAFAALHKAYAARRGATIWGDKSPVYYDSLPTLARLFPRAKFIIQWRDSAATANAIARAEQSGFKRRGAYVRGLIGYEVLKRGVDSLLNSGHAVCQVIYEELTSNPAKVMREVCSFLEIPYTDDLADLRDADRSAVFKEPHHALIHGDEIVSTPRKLVLGEDSRKKIARYVKLWKQRYNNEWPPSAVTNPDGVPLPRLSERLRDAVSYRAVRAYYQFRQVCFAYAPIAFMERYRGRMRGMRFPAHKQTREAQG